MTTLRLTRRVVSLALVAAAVACVRTQTVPDERMLQLGSALTKLSRAVDTPSAINSRRRT